MQCKKKEVKRKCKAGLAGPIRPHPSLSSQIEPQSFHTKPVKNKKAGGSNARHLKAHQRHWFFEYGIMSRKQRGRSSSPSRSCVQEQRRPSFDGMKKYPSPWPKKPIRPFYLCSCGLLEIDYADLGRFINKIGAGAASSKTTKTSTPAFATAAISIATSVQEDEIETKLSKS